MAGTYDDWEYARFVYVVGRSLRINPATGAEKTSVQSFVTSMVAKRPWLVAEIEENAAAEGFLNNDYYYGKAVIIIGRNLRVIPLRDSEEKALCDALFVATGDRMYGAQGTTIAADVQQS